MTVSYLSRSAWGAAPPNRPSPQRAATQYVFVHHSATLNPTSTPRPDDIEESKEQTRAFQADHLARTVTLQDGTVIPWADLAYNMLVGPGCLLEGRGWDARGGGTGPGQRVQHPSGSWDNVSVSICVIGNYQTEQLDPATREALLVAFREARRLFPGDIEVRGDRDVNFTSCCGDNLYNQIGDLWAESGEDDMTAEQFAAMLGPVDRCKAIGGVVHINLRKEDGSDDGWWPVGDVLEFTHRHIKNIDINT